MGRVELVGSPAWAFASASSCCGQALVPLPCLTPLGGSTSPRYPFSTRRLLIGPSKPRQRQKKYMRQLEAQHTLTQGLTVGHTAETSMILYDKVSHCLAKHSVFGRGAHISSYLEVGGRLCRASCPSGVAWTLQCLAASGLVQDFLMQACHASCLSFVAQTCPCVALAGHEQQVRKRLEFASCCLAHKARCTHCLLCEGKGANMVYGYTTHLFLYLLWLRSQSMGGLRHSGLFRNSKSVSLYPRHRLACLQPC